VVLSGAATSSTTGRGAGAIELGSNAPPGRGISLEPASASRAGEALGKLVAPSFYADGDRREPRETAAVRASAPATTSRSTRSGGAPPVTVVQTGPAEPPPAPAPTPAPPPPQPRPAPPARSSSSGFTQEWIVEQAKKWFAEGNQSSGRDITLAEMTLVTAAPKTQIAASEMTASRAPVQAMSTPQASGGQAEVAAPDAAKPDVDKIAQEVYERICRMLEVARERSGDPWSR
jgi:hypothetical protein